MKPRAVMIFAAGFGTRLMPLTKDRPKPMVSLLGRPMIDHTLDLVRAVAPERIVVNTHYKPDVLRDHLRGSDIRLIDEQPDILDTGGGLRNAIADLGPGPVWTINPDAVWQGENPLGFILEHWDADKMDALLLCLEPTSTYGRTGAGDFQLLEDGRVKRGAGVVYGGVQIIKTDMLAAIPERVFSLNKVWDDLIQTQRCFGVVYPGHWCDIGHPEGIPLAEDMLRARQDV